MTPQRQKGLNFLLSAAHTTHHPTKPWESKNKCIFLVMNVNEWTRYWGQIAWMQKLSPHGCSTLAPVATHPTFYWNINQQILIQQQQHGICQFSFKENWKMLSATRLTVALTMKTNALLFSIGFQYIRQLAKFGRKEGIFYPQPPFFSAVHFKFEILLCENVISKVFLFWPFLGMYSINFLQ